MVVGLVRPKCSSSFQIMAGGLFVDNLFEKKLIFAVEIFSFRESLKSRQASRRGSMRLRLYLQQRQSKCRDSCFSSGVNHGSDFFVILKVLKGAVESRTEVMFLAVVSQMWSISRLLKAKDQSNWRRRMVNSSGLIDLIFRKVRGEDVYGSVGEVMIVNKKFFIERENFIILIGDHQVNK